MAPTNLMMKLILTIQLLIQLLLCFVVGFACQAIEWFTWKLACLISIGRDTNWEEKQHDYLREYGTGRCDAFPAISSSDKAADAVADGLAGFVKEKEMTDMSRKMTKSNNLKSPDELIAHTKQMLKEKFGAFDDDQGKWLTDDFVFIFPIIYMPDRASYLDLIRAGRINFDKNRTYQYGFLVDPFEPNRVWYMERQAIKVGNEWKPLGVQKLSVSWCPETNKCYKFTGGYVVDRTNNYNNCGGLGAGMGVFYANGLRLPIKENLPRQTTLEFRGWVTFLYGVLEMWKPRPDAGIYEFPIALIKKVTDYFKSSKSLAATKDS